MHSVRDSLMLECSPIGEDIYGKCLSPGLGGITGPFGQAESSEFC